MSFLNNAAITVGSAAAVLLIVAVIVWRGFVAERELEICDLLRRFGRLDAHFLARRIANDRGVRSIAFVQVRAALWFLERRGIVLRKEVGVSPGYKGRTYYWLVESKAWLS
jgi:hypothetical protein